MLLGYNKNTLGKMKKNYGLVISSTIVYLRCDMESCCNMWKTSNGNYKKYSTDKNYCQSCKNRLGISGIKGKKHSENTLNKLRGMNLGDNNPSKRPEVRKKISQKLKGRDVYWLKGKKRPEHSKKMKVFMNKVYNPNNGFMNDYREKLITHFSRIKVGYHSKLHDLVKSYMLKSNICSFKSEQRIGRYQVDEVDFDKKVIVEVYGDFWHANPKKYNETDILPHFPKKKPAKNIWKYDNKRQQFLESLGYKVIILWESDIKKEGIDICKRLL